MTTHNKNPFIGKWRIISIGDFASDYIDMEVLGHLTFEKKNVGNFQFGLVQGDMDCRVVAGRMEFTWSGMDECDEACGRGFAEIAAGELCGFIYFHLGDDYAFRAIKQTEHQQ